MIRNQDGETSSKARNGKGVWSVAGHKEIHLTTSKAITPGVLLVNFDEEKAEASIAWKTSKWVTQTNALRIRSVLRSQDGKHPTTL